MARAERGHASASFARAVRVAWCDRRAGREQAESGSRSVAQRGKELRADTGDAETEAAASEIVEGIGMVRRTEKRFVPGDPAHRLDQSASRPGPPISRRRSVGEQERCREYEARARSVEMIRNERREQPKSGYIRACRAAEQDKLERSTMVAFAKRGPTMVCSCPRRPRRSAREDVPMSAVVGSFVPVVASSEPRSVERNSTSLTMGPPPAAAARMGGASGGTNGMIPSRPARAMRSRLVRKPYRRRRRARARRA